LSTHLTCGKLYAMPFCTRCAEDSVTEMGNRSTPAAAGRYAGEALRHHAPLDGEVCYRVVFRGCFQLWRTITRLFF